MSYHLTYILTKYTDKLPLYLIGLLFLSTTFGYAQRWWAIVNHSQIDNDPNAMKWLNGSKIGYFWALWKISEGNPLHNIKKSLLGTHVLIFFINISFEKCDFPYFSGIPSNHFTQFWYWPVHVNELAETHVGSWTAVSCAYHLLYRECFQRYFSDWYNSLIHNIRTCFSYMQPLIFKWF